jgi:ABC-type Fe3+-hydroxamate transport system substrate-binding protein
MFKVRDDRGRELVFHHAPRRVVSLVPSDTYTIAKLAGVERLVGRTDYCVEPAGEVEGVPTVGGTKNAKAEAILDLLPDLVIANQEENERSTLEAIAQRGVPVFVVFPKRVEDGIALVARYARLLGVEREERAKAMVRACHRAVSEAQRARAEKAPLRVFCPIWMDPLMTIHGATYISDALDLAGAANVFADRPRRYPLAADLGKAPPLPADEVEGRDTRYPRVTLDEVTARGPEAIVLPDEPHAFSEDDGAVFRALDVPASKPHGARADRVAHVNGRDLCWYGAWAADGIPRLGHAIDELR